MAMSGAGLTGPSDEVHWCLGDKVTALCLCGLGRQDKLSKTSLRVGVAFETVIQNL